MSNKRKKYAKGDIVVITDASDGSDKNNIGVVTRISSFWHDDYVHLEFDGGNEVKLLDDIELIDNVIPKISEEEMVLEMLSRTNFFVLVEGDEYREKNELGQKSLVDSVLNYERHDVFTLNKNGGAIDDEA